MKNRKKELEQRELQALRILEGYEILENMKRNDDEGKIPKMLSFEKANLLEFLESEKGTNELIKMELEKIRKELNQL